MKAKSFHLRPTRLYSIAIACGNTNVNYMISDDGGVSPIRWLLQTETVPTEADHLPD